MLVSYKGIKPQVSPDAIITRGAFIIGDVKIGERSSVWFGAVIRGDVDSVEIGHTTSVQDCAVIHPNKGQPVKIGNHVTIGHSAVLHGCVIEDAVLIGMNATVLDGAVIGSGSVVAAGCVVTPNTVVPPNSLVAGVPGKVIKDLGEASKAARVDHAEHYAELATAYAVLQDREVIE